MPPGRDRQDGLFAAAASPPEHPERPAATAAGRPALHTTAGFALAETDPVARVHLIGVLPHLDRPFDYAVTAETAAAGPGMRVKVRFSGREMDGVVLERTDTPSTDRPLSPLLKLVSEDVVLTPAMERICRDVAERTAGTFADVLRLALPPRHARAERNDRADEKSEKQTRDEAPNGSQSSGALTPPPGSPEPSALAHYQGSAAFLEHALSSGGPVPRASITLEPVDAWMDVAADALSRLGAADGGLVIAPDHRDVRRLSRVLDAHGIAHEVLGAADGPEKRYRAFRRILRGASRIVIGSRSAAFAPVRNLRLMILWDEADDLLDEPRAPYPSTRTVLQCRSAEEGAALLLLSASLSPTVLALAQHGYLHLLEPVRRPLGTVRPRIEAMDEHLREREGPSGRSRLPQHAMRLIRAGLQRGPVLVQVPRRGYVPAVACTFCGTRCICPSCSAPLSLRSRTAALDCRVCGRRENAYRCPVCHRTEIRAISVGSSRTAEELRRALPDAAIRVAGGAHGPLEDEDVPEHALVISTPGAEPWPVGGYAAALLMDADALMGRAAYDADVEALRRWRNAIAMVRPHEEGGEVLVIGTATLPPIRDVVAHRSQRFLDSVLEDREALQLPPAARIAEVAGDRDACRRFLEDAQLPVGTAVFGPVDLAEDVDDARARAVLRVQPGSVRELADALRAAVASRSAHKVPGSLRVRLDPPDVL